MAGNVSAFEAQRAGQYHCEAPIAVHDEGHVARDGAPGEEAAGEPPSPRLHVHGARRAATSTRRTVECFAHRFRVPSGAHPLPGMIVTFVLDTSTSMTQRAANGLSLLDIAKSAIEFFLKIRGRDPQAIRTDRFLLVTFDDGPGAVRVGWKDPFMAFLQEVKNATAKDLTQVGPALKRAFDLMNQFRLQTSIDNYGQGRVPWFLEPAAVILLTDGGSFSSPTGITDTVRRACIASYALLLVHATRSPPPR